MNTDLEAAFHQEMLNVYYLAQNECHYNANRFLQMVTDHGGLIAAKLLLGSKHHAEGLTRLWEEGRLDISMEALVLRMPWCELFSIEDLSVAHKRLSDLGYIGLVSCHV